MAEAFLFAVMAPFPERPPEVGMRGGLPHCCAVAAGGVEFTLDSLKIAAYVHEGRDQLGGDRTAEPGEG